MRSRKAMTLFEVLIVLLVIIILTLIGFYSSSKVIVETKVARVQEELILISWKLENYHVDFPFFFAWHIL